MKDVRVHAVILAGEKGELLWPLSRKNHPKQTLPFIEDTSLLEQTIERIAFHIPKQRRWIVTNVEYQDFIIEKLDHLVAGIIVEPEFRDTASAMMLAASLITQQDPDALLLFLPSDHYIPQKDLFWEFVHHAVDYVSTYQKITLFALPALYPSTDYGYIECASQEDYPSLIKNFYKNPTLESAHKYFNLGYMWNTGIAVVEAKVFIDIVKKLSIEVFEAVSSYVEGCGNYSESPSLSFESLFVSGINYITALPFNFIWQDIGNLERFLSLKNALKPDENFIQIDAKDNLVEAEGSLVAVVGVDNLCIIKKDDILLIVHRDQVEKVKQIIDTLKKGHKEEYL